MRNKIIALCLTVVMALLALAGCASSYNYAEEDLSAYATIDPAFIEALKNIEITDADFTTDEDTRQAKVTEKIVTALVDYAEKNGEQKKDGELGAGDVLYYAYYTSYTDDKGDTHYFDMAEMKTSDFTSSTTTVKGKHSIKLSSVDVEDEKADKLLVALKKAIEALETKTVSAYKTVTTSGISIKDAENKPNYDSVYVTYVREYTDKEGAIVKQETSYEKINLKEESALVNKLLDANTTVKINKDIEIKAENDVTKNVFEITEGEGDDAITYKYSSFKVLFAVETEGEELVSFKYAPYTAEKKIEPDSLHTADVTVTIPKEAELTYHVYPVYYYEVSDIDATSIITEILGTKITATSLDIFSSEEYKNGDKTVKALVEELVNLQGDKSEDENLKNLKKEYDDAAAAVKAAGDKATSEQTTKEETTKKAYEDAKKAAVAAKVAEIVAATKEGADPIGEVIVKEYREDTYHTLKETYDQAIVDKLGNEIWLLVEKYVTVNSYPEKLIKEAVEHLKNEYEYKFYNENVSSTEGAQSNYTAHGGSFDAYIRSVYKLDTTASKADVEAKLVAEAQDYVKPIIQLYVASNALAATAEASMKAQLDENAFKFEDDNEKEFAYYCAENFMVDDDALKAYKKIFGKSNYDIYVENYGEANFRTSLQANNFYDYLLSAKLAETKDGDHSHAEYTYAEGKIAFYNIGYSIKK